MALNVGSRLGHYDVTAVIGEGGMGQVYQAIDTKLNKVSCGIVSFEVVNVGGCESADAA